MRDDSAWRRDVKKILDGARLRIAHYTGLYSDEDLIGAVLHASREAASRLAADHRLNDARQDMELRCRLLVRAADRFGARDMAAIAAARAQALAAVDAFQEAVLRECRLRQARNSLGPLLRRPAL